VWSWRSSRWFSILKEWLPEPMFSGKNIARLLELKRRYDPDGVFTATPLPEAAPA
jgi:FAD/FMN-containing dehydrogenase